MALWSATPIPTALAAVHSTEPGTLLYALCRDPKNSALVFAELYTDMVSGLLPFFFETARHRVSHRVIHRGSHR